MTVLCTRQLPWRYVSFHCSTRQLTTHVRTLLIRFVVYFNQSVEFNFFIIAVHLLFTVITAKRVMFQNVDIQGNYLFRILTVGKTLHAMLQCII